MKKFTLLTLTLFTSAALMAGWGPDSPAVKTNSGGWVRLEFDSHYGASHRKDSVLIIFDRYNRTGAGVIFRVFREEKDHSVTIPQIPAGKYYVTIQCMGLHHERMEKIIKVRPKKGRRLLLKTTYTEEFSKDRVVIPPYKPDLTTLASASYR